MSCSWSGFKMRRTFFRVETLWWIMCWTLILSLDNFLVEGARSSCEFPRKWSGKWFQKGIQPPIIINKNYFSTKGDCVEARGDMFLMEDRHERCFRCVVIYEKHENVLQYRETYCDEPSSLREACRRLTVDAQLHSLFRVDAVKIECPFRGAFDVSYNRGHGECQVPPSNAHTCSDPTMMLFRFQACVDVHPSESSTEELTCLASWKEGSQFYLVGRMVRKLEVAYRTFNDAESYRCFIYEVNGGEKFVMSESADATCDGLISASEGSRTITLRKLGRPEAACRFPEWLSKSRRWLSLDARQTYVFHDRAHTRQLASVDKSSSLNEIICVEEVSEGFNVSTVVAQFVSGCVDGFVCMSFHKRDNSIVEIQMGRVVRDHQLACSMTNYELKKNEYITLIDSKMPPRPCPMFSSSDGFRVSGNPFWLQTPCSSSASHHGCRHHNQFELITECGETQRKHQISAFVCQSEWQNGEQSFFVATDKTTAQRFCFMYIEEGGLTRIMVSPENCPHHSALSSETQFALNITANGKCSHKLENAIAMATESVASRQGKSAILIVFVSLFLTKPHR